MEKDLANYFIVALFLVFSILSITSSFETIPQIRETIPINRDSIAGMGSATVAKTTESSSLWQITGSGTPGQLPKFKDTSVIGDSIVTEAGGNIGIGTNNPQSKLDVAGSISANSNIFLKSTAGFQTEILSATNTGPSLQIIQRSSGEPWHVITASWWLKKLWLLPNGDGSISLGGDVSVSSMAGEGNAYACVDSTGKLYRSNSPCV